MIDGLAARFPGLPLSVVNEPEGRPFHTVLLEMGFAEARARWEMRWQNERYFTV